MFQEIRSPEFFKSEAKKVEGLALAKDCQPGNFPAVTISCKPTIPFKASISCFLENMRRRADIRIEKVIFSFLNLGGTFLLRIGRLINGSWFLGNRSSCLKWKNIHWKLTQIMWKRWRLLTFALRFLFRI